MVAPYVWSQEESIFFDFGIRLNTTHGGCQVRIDADTGIPNPAPIPTFFVFCQYIGHNHGVLPELFNTMGAVCIQRSVLFGSVRLNPRGGNVAGRTGLVDFFEER